MCSAAADIYRPSDVFGLGICPCWSMVKGSPGCVRRPPHDCARTDVDRGVAAGIHLGLQPVVHDPVAEGVAEPVRIRSSNPGNQAPWPCPLPTGVVLSCRLAASTTSVTGHPPPFRGFSLRILWKRDRTGRLLAVGVSNVTFLESGIVTGLSRRKTLHRAQRQANFCSARRVTSASAPDEATDGTGQP